jgi:hypothetical protein
MQTGSKKALMVLRVPLSALTTGPAVTLKQAEVMGLRLGEPWNGARVTTVLTSLLARCGWPWQVVSDCGSASKKGLVATFLEAPTGASWIRAMTHWVAHALQQDEAKRARFQPLQTLGTRMRQRLQQTPCAFLLPPKARAQGRLLHVSRQAAWGLRTIASWEAKAREHPPEASALASALRGRKPCKPFFTHFGRHTPCVNAVMRSVKTHGLRVDTMPAWQARRGDLPARSPLRTEVSDWLPHSLPVVESRDSPLWGSRDVIASLMGQAPQRLDAHGRSELHKSILLIPCLCGERTPDLVAEALTTVRVQDVSTGVSETVGETMQSVRRRALSRPQSQKPGTKTADRRSR